MTAPTDLVVVLPGILGSTLRQDGHLIWAPSAGSALRAIATFGASLRRIELPAGIGDQHPCDGVEPAALMPDLHVLPGIWTAVKAMTSCWPGCGAWATANPARASRPATCCRSPMTGGCRAGTTPAGSPRSSSLPCSGGGTRADPTPTPRWCSCATPWAG
jgi:hypothetical protein